MNNKGFAITTLLYGLSILGLLLILVLMSTVTSNRHNTKEVVQEIEEDLSRFSVSQASITLFLRDMVDGIKLKYGLLKKEIIMVHIKL